MLRHEEEEILSYFMLCKARWMGDNVYQVAEAWGISRLMYASATCRHHN